MNQIKYSPKFDSLWLKARKNMILEREILLKSIAKQQRIENPVTEKKAVLASKNFFTFKQNNC